MSRLDAVAEATSVVNTIKIMRQASGIRLLGFNTDAYGFECAIRPLLTSAHRKALILGTGASSRTVSYVLKNSGIACAFASRHGSGNAYSYSQLNAQIMAECTIVVNTTPVGTFPDTEDFPDIPYQYLTSGHLLFDLVYNPALTLFLKKGMERGAAVQNGHVMLKLQADQSWEIWNDPNLS